MVIGKLTKTSCKGIYRRESDGRLVIRVTARLPGGRWSQQTEVQPEDSTLERARRRAEVLRQRVQDQAEEIRNDGEISTCEKSKPVTLSTETVGEYAKRWYATRSPRLKPGPRKRYENVIWDKIIPRLGDVRVAEVSRSTVEAWVTWAERARQPSGGRYARGTLMGWWRVLVSILRDMAADHNTQDPVRRVRPPESNRTGCRESRVLTDEELSRFLEAVETFAPDHYVAILTMARTGMRAGEVYALRWDCIDFTREEIVVRRSISNGELTETTKTHAPRIVPMHSTLVEALKSHRKQMMEEQHPGLRDNWVFPNVRGGMRLPQAIRPTFQLATEAAKIDQVVSPQVLRRGFNTALLRAGVDRIVLRSILGHCSEEMTARYAGVDSADKKAAILRLFPVKVATGGDGEEGE